MTAEEIMALSQFVHKTLRPMTIETWDMDGLCQAIEDEYPSLEYSLDYDYDPGRSLGNLKLSINHPAEVTIYGEVTDSGGGVPGRRYGNRQATVGANAGVRREDDLASSPE